MFKLLTLIPSLIFKFLGLFTKALFRHGVITVIASVLILGSAGYFVYNSNNQLKFQLLSSQGQAKIIQDQLAKVKADFEALKNQDQVKRDDALEQEIKNIQETYKKGLKSYESLTDLKTSPNISKADSKDLTNLDKQFAQSLQQLAEKNYSSASASLDTLNKDIQSIKDKITPTPPPVPAGPAVDTSAPTTTTPPDSGYQRINVASSNGTFPVDIISADLGSTKVIVDTASDSDCANNCPVMPLGNYASRSGAYAAINGPFFCPATYPSCAGKTNSFDTLLMNKNKHYLNSSNNVYSNVPAAIFSAGSARYVGRSLEWGRDTDPDSVIANYPLLVAGGNIVFSGSDDPKFGSKGPRGFIATKGGKVYIGFVYNANMSDSAATMKALGMDQALNLDEGGSTALWFQGRYVAGPGRDLPFGILFVKR